MINNKGDIMKKIAMATILILLMSVFVVTLSACRIREGSFEFTYDKLTDTYALAHYNDLTSVTEVRIPDEVRGAPVTSISRHGMSNALNVKKIIIGANITEIDVWAICNNPVLEEIEVLEGNKHFKSIDGVLFDITGEILITFPNSNGGVPYTNDKGEPAVSRVYTVPDGVVEIRANAFYRCVGLTGVILPDTVEIIGERAFLRCTNLEFVQLGNGVKEIREVAFLDCNSKLFTEISIPASIEIIGDDVFYNCKFLLSINVGRPENEIRLGKNWFPTDLGNTIKELVINYGK